jgi:uncharacterized protein YggE
VKAKLIILLVLAAAVAAVPAFAGGTADAPAAATGGKLTVVGNAAVESTPDVTAWSFGATAQGDSAVKAIAAANAAAKKVVAAVRAAGVAQADIRTEYVSVSPQTNEKGQLIDRFVASTSISVTVRKIASAGKVVDAAVDAGANTVNGPSFSDSEREALYRQALRAAVAQAKLSAQVLAEASNVTLGRVVEVQEGGGSVPVPLAAEASKAADTGVQIEPGRSSTYATVSVTWSTS